MGVGPEQTLCRPGAQEKSRGLTLQELGVWGTCHRVGFQETGAFVAELPGPAGSNNNKRNTYLLHLQFQS